MFTALKSDVALEMRRSFRKSSQEEAQKRMSRRGGGWLEVHVYSARNLKSCDSNGFSDPFCQVSVAEARTFSGGSRTSEQVQPTQFRTEIMRKTLDPVVRYEQNIH
jgi:Ca2+-dependent lipid-binding protein